LTNGNENEKKIVEKHEVTDQNQKAQLQEAIFQESYLKNQLSKVEELTQQTQTPQIIHTPPKPN
jgi:hypothetical protein